MDFSSEDLYKIHWALASGAKTLIHEDKVYPIVESASSTNVKINWYNFYCTKKNHIPTTRIYYGRVKIGTYLKGEILFLIECLPTEQEKERIRNLL